MMTFFWGKKRHKKKNCVFTNDKLCKAKLIFPGVFFLYVINFGKLPNFLLLFQLFFLCPKLRFILPGSFFFAFVFQRQSIEKKLCLNQFIGAFTLVQNYQHIHISMCHNVVYVHTNMYMVRVSMWRWMENPFDRESSIVKKASSQSSKTKKIGIIVCKEYFSCFLFKKSRIIK